MHRAASKCMTFAGLGLVLICIGCAATPYRRNVGNYSGGYWEHQESATIHWILFSGNGRTPNERIDLFLEYRCAEFTIERGYTHYYILPWPPQEHFINPQYPRHRILLTNGPVPDYYDRELINAEASLARLKPKVMPYMLGNKKKD